MGGTDHIIVDYAERNKSHARHIIGTILGSLGIFFALLILIGEIRAPLILASHFPRGTKLNLMIPAAAQFAGTLFAIFVCGVCGVLCVFLHGGRRRSWIIAGIGFALALASGPIGKWIMDYVMAKYGLIDAG